MPIRHVKENQYAFTKESYEIYLEIPSKFLNSFWDFIESDGDDLIMLYMVRSWIVDQDLCFPIRKVPGVYDMVCKLKNCENIPMIEIFNKPSQFIYKGQYYPIDYDLEYAEAVFAKYERSVDDSTQFGSRWWYVYDQVMTVIKSQIEDPTISGNDMEPSSTIKPQ
jgi:hypothetical protein